MRTRTYLILLLTCCAASGQFSSLTTTRDGSVVYFATPLRQKNTSQPDYGKLFRFDTRVTLQESRELVPPKPIPSGIAGVGLFELSNAFDFSGASVSSDGATLASTASRSCIGNTVRCRNTDKYVTTVSSGGRSQEFAGSLLLSANGKWAFGNSSLLSHYYLLRGYRVDLTSGAVTEFSEKNHTGDAIRIASAGRPVANDGTGVYCDDSTIYLMRTEASPRLTLSNHDLPRDAVIDAAASVIVYSVVRNLGNDRFVYYSSVRSLLAVAVDGGEPRLLDAEGYSPTISDDGSRVLYMRRVDGVAQVWMIDVDGTSRRQLTSEPAGISSATLSGDGDTAYAVTLGARIIRIATASGEISEVVARTPWLDPYQLTAPDRFSVFRGIGLAASDATQATIQGKPVRVLAIEPEAISILFPPDVEPTEYPDYYTPLSLSGAPGSPFEGPRTPVRITKYRPELLYVRPGRPESGVAAVHEDWSGLVTEAAPARAGEVVHLYATGLGTTTPAVPFGEAAPLVEPLARLRVNYTCAESPNTTKELAVLYQGRAPGMIGIYQVDVRLPEEINGGWFGLSCVLSSDPFPDWRPAFGGRIATRQ